MAAIIELDLQVFSPLRHCHRLATATDQIVSFGCVGGHELAAVGLMRASDRELDGELANQEPAGTLHYALVGVEVRQYAGVYVLRSRGLARKRRLR